MMKIIVFGGKGFLGQVVSKVLTKKHTVFTADRHPGDLTHKVASITSRREVIDATKGMDIIVNLIGLSPLRQPRQGYGEVHVEGVKNIIAAAKKNKIKRIIHISAQGAALDASTQYLRTKAEAESLLISSGIKVTILRPHILVGKGHELDKLAQKLGWMRMYPHLHLKMQPVGREVVAKLVMLSCAGKIKQSALDVHGKQTVELFDIVKTYFSLHGYACLPLPQWFAFAGAFIASKLHLFGITSDQLKALSLSTTSADDTIFSYIEVPSFTEVLEEEFSS